MAAFLTYVAVCAAYPHPDSDVGKKDGALVPAPAALKEVPHGTVAESHEGDMTETRDARLFWPFWGYAAPGYGWGWGGYPYGGGSYYWG